MCPSKLVLLKWLPFIGMIVVRLISPPSGSACGIYYTWQTAYIIHCTVHPIVCLSKVLPWWLSRSVQVRCFDRLDGYGLGRLIKLNHIPQRSEWPNYTCAGKKLAPETKLSVFNHQIEVICTDGAAVHVRCPCHWVVADGGMLIGTAVLGVDVSRPPGTVCLDLS